MPQMETRRDATFSGVTGGSWAADIGYACDEGMLAAAGTGLVAQLATSPVELGRLK